MTTIKRERRNKSILLSMVFLLTVSACQGQAALIVLIFGNKVATETFHVSMDGGVSVSNLSGLEQSAYTTGLYFGLGTHIKLSEQWTLSPEFKILSPGGAKNVEAELSGGQILDSKSEIKLNYLDVPVLVQYEFARNFSFGFGPQISFLNRAVQIVDGSLSTGESVTVSRDIKSELQDYSFSFPLQLAYSISDARSGKGINLKVRYNHSFNNVFEESSELSSTNTSWQIFLSFPFVLPKE